ncbi:MAG: PAS domain-containing protein [Anaerolineae bacterium]|nr:PAS domain-containing protein [Anaerolineae bacterium]
MQDYPPRKPENPIPSVIDIAALDLWMNRGENRGERDFPVAQLLQLVLDNIPQAVFWKNRDSVYVWCNLNFAIDAGVGTPYKIIGKTDYDLAWTRDQADSYRSIDQQVMDTNTPVYQIVELQTQADGKQAWLVTNKMPLHDQNGNVIGVLGTYEDITERKEGEEALQRAHDELEMRVKERTAAEREQRNLAEALRDTAALLNSTLNLDEVLDRILTAIGRVVPHETANIILLEGDTAHVVRFRDQVGQYGMYQNLDRRFPLNELPNLVQMATTHQPMILSDTFNAVKWVTRPDTVWVRSYLGAPIETDGKVIGFINLNSAIPHFFDGLHAEHLRAFADQAATAIHNARLYKQAQELAALQERQRLARDLHDAVSQTLWTASLIADVLPTVWEEDREEGRRSLEKLQRLTRGALAEMRTLLLELRPSSLVEATLGNLMEQLAAAVMSRKKLDISVNVSGECRLPPDVQIGLYRLAQESLNNIAKHSRATQASINLECKPGYVNLQIEDNGRGFNPAEVPPDRLGLGFMRERAETLGAKLEIFSEMGRGVRISIIWDHLNRG